MNLTEFIKKHHLISITLQLSAFAALSVISKLWLKDLYLFEWTARNTYCYVWAAACLFSFFGKNIIGISVTAGAVLGVFIAQPIGEYIRTVNISKVTADTDPQREALLYSNPAWLIWIIIILSALVIGIFITVIKNYRCSKGN